MEVLAILLVTIAGSFPAVVFCYSVDLRPFYSVIYHGQNSTFSCVTVGNANFQWLLNGTRLEDLPNIDTAIVAVALIFEALMFMNVPADYNNTIVQCVATFIFDGSTLTSNNGTLQIQGLLGAVGDLRAAYEQNSTNLTISWSVPFALTVSSENIPEISYCVDIINTTSSGIIYSVCDLIEMVYVLDDLDCETKYKVVITPVNRIGNGTNSTTFFPDLKYLFTDKVECRTSVAYDVQAVQVFCNFNKTVVTGYVVVLQYNDPSSSLAVELRTSMTRDLNSIVEVVGVDNGQYCMTVFPLLSTSFVGSGVAFRQKVEVTPFPITTVSTDTVTSMTNSTTTASPTFTSTSNTSNKTAAIVIIIIPVSLFAVIVTVIIIIIVGILVFLYCKKEKRDSKDSGNPSDPQSQVIESSSEKTANEVQNRVD